MSGKDVRFGVEARALMLQGVDKLADAVQVRRRTPRRAALSPAQDGSSLSLAPRHSCDAASWTLTLTLTLTR